MRWIGPALLIAAAVFAQDPPKVPDDTVVAVLNGRKFTAAEVRRLVNGAPAAVKLAFERDPKQFLREHAFYMMLVEYAEKNKLDQKSPYRDTLEFYRLTVLTNAALNYKMDSIDVSLEEQQRYYQNNQDRFREAKVRMIYVPFSDPLSEEQAKTKAATLARRARSGEDFAKLAAESGGQGSSAPEEFTVRRDSPQPPEYMRKVILNEKVGAITDPLRHDNGYYVFRVESIDVLPFDKVRDDIYKEIQNARLREWQAKTRAQVTVQFENEAFFQGIGQKQ
jgi:parvulin-like peptidyl-prolyl isomerase